MIFPPINFTINIPTDEEKEKGIKELKEKAQKSKVIALDHLRKPIFTNPSLLSKREKDNILKMMSIWMDKPDDEVNSVFNEIMIDKLELEYDKIPINPMNITYAPDPELHRNLPPMDIAGNLIQSTI
jgi:hypothetical protein